MVVMLVLLSVPALMLAQHRVLLSRAAQILEASSFAKHDIFMLLKRFTSSKPFASFLKQLQASCRACKM
jgi:hypothetical protein